MKPIRAVPDPVLIPLQGKQTVQPATAVPELRQMRIEEFFQARSLAPNTEKAYRHDLEGV